MIHLMLQPSKINFEAPLLDYMIIKTRCNPWRALPSLNTNVCTVRSESEPVIALCCGPSRCGGGVMKVVGGDGLVEAKPQSWTVAAAVASEQLWPLSLECC